MMLGRTMKNGEKVRMMGVLPDSPCRRMLGRIMRNEEKVRMMVVRMIKREAE